MRAYLDNIAVAYATCDLAVCRAGAMTIAELGVTGTPAIFIPYPFAAQDHQTNNARFVESKGAAQVIPQSELTSTSLVQAVRGILADTERLAAMRKAMSGLAKPNAAADLAKQLKQTSTSYQTRSKSRSA
jgi:UDP-N-acetylglucosamine--N-acetylmuramyl-(pentapeptide) pyrophosphoryl-undecaprenol N-acetylglucosamine transferase